jgi:hypothetical protein
MSISSGIKLTYKLKGKSFFRVNINLALVWFCLFESFSQIRVPYVRLLSFQLFLILRQVTLTPESVLGLSLVSATY